jgi:hypothetical protein
MRTTLTARLRNALAFEWRQPSDVHFHSGAHGRAFVCDRSRCDSPRLSATEVEIES